VLARISDRRRFGRHAFTDFVVGQLFALESRCARPVGKSGIAETTVSADPVVTSASLRRRPSLVGRCTLGHRDHVCAAPF
jgi:hypothetical protein